MGHHITHDNPVVQGLARIFFFVLSKAETGKILEWVGKNVMISCGPQSYWWWRPGQARVEILAISRSLPDGSLNDFGGLPPDISSGRSDLYHSARQLSIDWNIAAKAIGLDYFDLYSSATHEEVVEAIRLAAMSHNQDLIKSVRSAAL